jgi:NAD(P)-dependent dehydrogenase (short-subunit alcohol dehydrogenase family)
MLLEGKAGLVTGGGSGIGKGAALLLGKEGLRVGVADLDRESAEQTAQEIRDGGGQALAVAADISRPAEVRLAVQRVVDEWGRLDVVFANAGINGVWAPLEELEPEEWDRTLMVNLKGTFLTVKYAMPHLKKQGGSVIITSSINGTRVFSYTGATAYSCSKAAQVAFAKMVALEVAKDRVRVNVICPGAIATEINERTETRDLEKVRQPVRYPKGTIPLTGGVPGSIEQVAQLVLFLASDASSHISGTEVWIDGAQSLLLG